MATIERFEDLEIWKEARKLCQEIVVVIEETALKTDYRLRDQVKAASGSVMDNIAEGFERDGNKEFRQFLSLAKGSAGEVRSQLYRIFDYGYITESKRQELGERYEGLGKRIAGFMSYLNKNEFRGTKFKDSRPGT